MTVSESQSPLLTDHTQCAEPSLVKGELLYHGHCQMAAQLLYTQQPVCPTLVGRRALHYAQAAGCSPGTLGEGHGDNCIGT